MVAEIIIALLGLIGTASGSLIGAFTSARLTNYRLEQLEKKVDNLSGNSNRIVLLEQKEIINDKRITALEAKAQAN